MPQLRGVAGVEGFYHGALLAVNAAGRRRGDAKRRFQLGCIQSQQTRASDRGAKAAEYRRAVKAAVLDVRRICSQFADHFDTECIGFQ